MYNLLSLGFYRLWRDKVFWFGVTVALLTSVISMALAVKSAAAMTAEGYGPYSLDEYYFSMTPFSILFCAVFASMFIGTEYSEGTMRNKIVVGRTRAQIYVSNYIICLVAGICFMAALLAGGLIGIPALGVWEIGLKGALVYMAISFLYTAAITGVFTLLCMLISNKAVAIVLSVLAALAIIVLVGTLPSNALGQPEFFRTSVETAEPLANPLYVSGFRRVFYQLILDCLPGGQAIQVANMGVERPLLSILSSVAISIGSMLIGLVAFRKKDIK
ncbi:MAG: ABC transporter permease [Clostridiaceae bacterium]